MQFLIGVTTLLYFLAYLATFAILLEQRRPKCVLLCIKYGFLCFCRVEGLLKNGAMKPDDRPLWYDVYRAFPPAVEPKFARPTPEIKPIRQILYQEDIVRA